MLAAGCQRRVLAGSWRVGRALSAAAPMATVLKDMEERGMVHATTSPQLAQEKGPLTVYAGFDPTASSLHVGNLLVIKSLLHFGVRGHPTIGLIGGATGIVGDPTGRSAERTSLPLDVVQSNASAISHQLKCVFERGIQNARRHLYPHSDAPDLYPLSCVNNADFYTSMNVLDFVTQVGRHARVSAMLARDSVKGRLASPEGLSFAELMYQLFQAHDFYHLHHHNNCRVQLGGSDQWGNITAGIDLIHRRQEEMPHAYGVTLPLVTDSRGEKFGKSAGNAVWLDPARTTPYDLYQFFLNQADDDAIRLLRLLTFVSLEQVERVAEAMRVNPQGREAQHLLAHEVVDMVHGAEAACGALDATKLLFGQDCSSMSAERLSVLRFAPHVVMKRHAVLAMSVPSLAVASGLCTSKSEATRLIQRSSLHLNDQPVASGGSAISSDCFLARQWMVLRSGKKHHRVVRIDDSMGSSSS